MASAARLERASIDEAYVDVSHLGSIGEGVRVAHELLEQTSSLGLPLSVGVGPNRLLAKLASTRAKTQHQTSAADASVEGSPRTARDCVCAVRDSTEVDALLSTTAALKVLRARVGSG